MDNSIIVALDLDYIRAIRNGLDHLDTGRPITKSSNLLESA